MKMFHRAVLDSYSRLRGDRRLSLPLASTAAVIALTSLTAPAKALSFNWQFTNENGFPVVGGIVTGTISGLLDNTPNQKTGLSVAVTSAPNAPTGGWVNDWTYVTSQYTGNGFSALNGVITAGNAQFINSPGDQLYFGDSATPISELSDYSFDMANFTTGGVTTYTPQISTVPGPLPILAAASALGWSRKVRNRLRSAQRSAR